MCRDIYASEEIGISVMMELSHRLLNGRGMPNEWQTSILMPIFKGKGDRRILGVKLLKHAMKIVERVLERRLRNLVNAHAMQFSFMLGRGTPNALFVVRRIREQVGTKRCICVL